MPDFDAIRAKYPHLGMAVYAFTPGGEVTLELLNAEGKTFSFTGATLAEAIEKFEPTPEPPAPPDASVFD